MIAAFSHFHAEAGQWLPVGNKPSFRSQRSGETENMLYKNQANQWLRQAGKLAMGYFRNVEPSLKENNTYVTEADLKVQAYLMEQIDANYPDVGVLAEEGDLIKKPGDGETTFVIDPIDGTASFVANLPVWGIALGVIKSNKPVAGYFYMPVTDDFFYVEPQGGVYRNDSLTALKAAENIHQESILLMTSRAHKKLRINTDYPGKARSLGSTIAHICYTATGSADASLVSGCYIWDLAAGLAMLIRNGGSAFYLNGDPFTLTDDLLAGNKLHMPVVLGHPCKVEYFLQKLSNLQTIPVS
jgi:myo-inositol-1(or 4)-monophosphatase